MPMRKPALASTLLTVVFPVHVLVVLRVVIITALFASPVVRSRLAGVKLSDICPLRTVGSERGPPTVKLLLAASSVHGPAWEPAPRDRSIAWTLRSPKPASAEATAARVKTLLIRVRLFIAFSFGKDVQDNCQRRQYRLATTPDPTQLAREGGHVVAFRPSLLAVVRQGSRTLRKIYPPGYLGPNRRFPFVVNLRSMQIHGDDFDLAVQAPRTRGTKPDEHNARIIPPKENATPYMRQVARKTQAIPLARTPKSPVLRSSERRLTELPGHVHRSRVTVGASQKAQSPTNKCQRRFSIRRR